MNPDTVNADLRTFYAIGFQNSKDGLWLKKQGLDLARLFVGFIESCMDKEIGLVVITTEDYRVNRGSPEDRFNFLLRAPLPLTHKSEYEINEVDENLFQVRRKYDNNILLVLNSETLNSPEKQSWGGLKLHVLGSNILGKHSKIEDTIRSCKDQGLPTFLTGITSEMSNCSVLDIVAAQAFGIITHDANNTYGRFATLMPFFGKSLLSKMRSSNKTARQTASYYDKPGIAVSSSHWPDEVGQAYTIFPSNFIDLQDPHSTQRLLEKISNALKGDYCTHSEGFNSRLRVAYTGYLLKKYGQRDGRFAGDPRSSYNPKATI
jgi:hypothetical protein